MEIIGNYCPVSGKECFDSRALAEKAMRRLNKRSAKQGSVYQCPECGKWHITHYGYNKDKSKREKMAGIGKFKIGAELRFKDNLGNYLKCGDCVRHTITDKQGVITQYGVVKGTDGTNYKLCDNIWEVINHKVLVSSEDIGEGPKVVEKKDTVAVIENEAGEKKLAVLVEKTLADFTPLEIAENFAKRYKEFQNGSKDAEKASRMILCNIRKGYLRDEFLRSVEDRWYLPTDLQSTFNKMREMYGKDLEGAVPTNAESFDDKFLAEELRKRGYEVTAEKTVKICL